MVARSAIWGNQEGNAHPRLAHTTALISRRIYSRLRATNIDSIAEYIEYLNENPSEYKNLLDAVTINVTEFFRNFPAIFPPVTRYFKAVDSRERIYQKMV